MQRRLEILRTRRGGARVEGATSMDDARACQSSKSNAFCFSRPSILPPWCFVYFWLVLATFGRIRRVQANSKRRRRRIGVGLLFHVRRQWGRRPG